MLSAGNELPATSHKASCGQDAGLTGADLVEQNCPTRLEVFENSRPTFDAHDISLAGLALVGDIAFTEPLELNGRQHFGLMLGIELGKLRKRAQPTPSQILVAISQSSLRCKGRAADGPRRLSHPVIGPILTRRPGHAN